METIDCINDFVEDFPIQAYEKRALARMYSPFSTTDRAAVAKLRKQVRMKPELEAELKAAGYRSKAQAFTKKQVAILVKHLGEP